MADVPAVPGTGFGDSTKEKGETTSSPARKQAPPEKQSDIRRRTYVVLSFWALIIFVGLPIWWNTTAIYRAHLPLSSMIEWADGKVRYLPEKLEIVGLD